MFAELYGRKGGVSGGKAGSMHITDVKNGLMLTTGIVGQEPIAQGANATAVNSAVEGFVRAAACELPRGIRINAVSPTVLTESMGAYGPFFPGFEPVPAARAALQSRGGTLTVR